MPVWDESLSVTVFRFVFCMGARAWTDTYTCVYMQTVLEIEYVGIDFPGPPCSLRARSQEYEELKKNPTIKECGQAHVQNAIQARLVSRLLQRDKVGRTKAPP